MRFFTASTSTWSIAVVAAAINAPSTASFAPSPSLDSHVRATETAQQRSHGCFVMPMAKTDNDAFDDTAAGLAVDEPFTSDRQRRSILLGSFAAAFAATAPSTAYAASLLEEFGDDGKKSTQKSSASTKAPPASVSKKSESSIEPNLRSNYYYPTNKKRYLPRIKRCSDEIPSAAEAIGREDWDSAALFATKVADDTVLPMKLYASSLSGGGTNVKTSFTGEMMDSAKRFEKSRQKLEKALAKKDQRASSAALEELSSALLTYRTAGRLLGPDGGGDIPSVEDIRRSACRVQGRTFEKAVKMRDERLKQAAESSSSSAKIASK